MRQGRGSVLGPHLDCSGGNSKVTGGRPRQVPVLTVNQWLPGWEKIAFDPDEHRQTAHGLGGGRFVLGDVPVLGEQAVLEADDVGGDPGGGAAVA